MKKEKIMPMIGIIQGLCLIGIGIYFVISSI